MRSIAISIPLILSIALPAPGCSASLSRQASRGLSIHFTDVEGGAATLIVTPSDESVLVDSGFPGERDAGRIKRLADEAGLTRIDHYITTHWHTDHMGGIGPLSEKMPVHQFYDRGGLTSTPPDRTDPKLAEAYQTASRSRAHLLHAGEEIPLKKAAGGPPLSLRCVVSNAMVEGDPALPAPASSGAGGGPAEAACPHHPAKPDDPSDNAKSLGFILRYGDFEFLDLGDLTWNVEHRLVCPTNRLGAVDLYQVTHHGQDSSNNPALLRAVSPRVAVVNNGPRKGGSGAVFAALKAVPEMEAVFQLHRNLATTDADNAPEDHIANLKESCDGEPVSVSVAPDSKSYSVKVGRSGLTRAFSSR